MSAQAPTMLLEIKVISATDLPPLARMLRTYVVACIDHDNKSQTAVDRHGGTNPTWNQKFPFYVDDRFLNSKTSEIKFEIYNVAWLRDLPMGTASLVISSIFPALSPKNPTTRSFALRICRPTGHLQGILNVGVQLKDNYRYGPPESSETGRQLPLRSPDPCNDGERQNMPKECKASKTMQKSDDMMISRETASLLESITTSYEEKSLLSCVTEQKLIGESKGTSNSNNHLLPQPEFVYFEKDKNGGGAGLKPKATPTTIRSVSSSGMHRLTSSEIAAGDYWGGDVEDDYLGNSIFESWIVAAAAEGETTMRNGSTWRPEDDIGPATGKDNCCRRGSRRCFHRRSQSEGGRGLFSLTCMKLKFLCGCNSTDKKKKRPSRRKKMLDDGADDHTAPLLSW